MNSLLNTEIQATQGAHFLHSACQEGGAHPCPPVSYATARKSRMKICERQNE